MANSMIIFDDSQHRVKKNCFLFFIRDVLKKMLIALRLTLDGNLL